TVLLVVTRAVGAQHATTLSTRTSVDHLPMYGSGLTDTFAVYLSLIRQHDPAEIVFISDRDGDYEIYAMRSDGSQQTNRSSSPASAEFDAQWSPGGSQFAFTTDRDGNFE